MVFVWISASDYFVDIVVASFATSTCACLTARPPCSTYRSVANRSTLSAKAQNMLRNKHIWMRPAETHRHYRSQKTFISRDAAAPPLAPVPPRPAGMSLRLNHGVNRRTEVWHVQRQLRARIFAKCHFAKNVNFFPSPPTPTAPPVTIVRDM